ncbi:MAG: aspartate aminotransferase family protein [bacterium]
MRMPKQGRTRDEVARQLEQFTKDDFSWRDGKAFAYTFDAGKEAEAVAKEAFVRFMSKNALDPTFFPSVLELENQIIAMTAAHLGGDADTAGAFTSGGTESIILAVKTARDYFRSVRPDISEPEMILPTTAHAAFHKAAHYLSVKVALVEVDPVTFRADPALMREAITENTILLVGSATSYAHGVTDPIPELGQLALEHGLLLHVDGCIGGFLLPYFKEFGADVCDFDLSVPGVSSISMDLHKYAYAPKGASVVLYKSRELRRHQIFACATWTGYTIVNTTVQSTKGAGPMAAAWAVLNFLGDDGYRKIARSLYDVTKQLTEGIESIPQLRLLGRPDLPLIAFTSDTINVFHVVDAMAKRGWHIQPQLQMGHSPANIHLSVNPSNVQHAAAMLADLREVVAQTKAKPHGKIAAAVSTMFGAINPDRMNDKIFTKMINMAGIKSVGVPDKMADINDIMNALPAKLSERLLIEYINRLFDQSTRGDPLPAADGRFALPRGSRGRAASNGHRASGWSSLGPYRTAMAVARNVRDRLVELGVPLPR